ncbi:putative transcriptional regulator [Methanosarcina barkeri str. Wiesmoor]|uniref:Dinitrogenase iron-molybdenum cofactor biosynthesis domain-containing protein n=2 Tax=Methanosarcina barkeri TaxID=2208 RepID=Q46BG8_METBF|nr:NifB/NifX family molybdenum-iron cluster-binding protein [Methanosarcina barkeri]AKB52155.1 putative transcriptional regulator [Methanosarcina barkeri str. Wiesmoor]
MKVSIPTKDENGMEGVVEPHFGKAPTYTIIDTETNQVTVIPNTSEHMGGTGLPPEYLHNNGVNIMLCGGLGFKAVNMFESYGIEVFVGAGGTVRDTFEAWKAGKLQNATAENSCSEHGHDDDHHC